MASQDTAEQEEFIKPSGRWCWVAVLVQTPIFFLIGLSIHNGWPPPDDLKSWIFLVALTIFPLAAHIFELALWHLREKLGRPAWWSAQLQRNVGMSILAAAAISALDIPDTARGWGALPQWFAQWALLIPVIFALFTVADWVLMLLKRAWISRRARKS